MAYQFKHKAKEEIVGSGSYVFRHFGDTEIVDKIFLKQFRLDRNAQNLSYITDSGTGVSLTITAEDCPGQDTTTVIHFTEVRSINGTEVTFTGDSTSQPFPQNLSETDPVQRTVYYSRGGMTASAVITHGVYNPHSYTIQLSGIEGAGYGFEKDSSVLPTLSSETYDGVYKSLNFHLPSSYAVAKVTFRGYTKFTIWINSFAESNFDYTMASTLDATSFPQSYSVSVCATATNGFQQPPDVELSGTYYKRVEYTTPDKGEHFFYIVYRKDSSVDNNYDRGYFIIEK